MLIPRCSTLHSAMSRATQCVSQVIVDRETLERIGTLDVSRYVLRALPFTVGDVPTGGTPIAACRRRDGAAPSGESAREANRQETRGVMTPPGPEHISEPFLISRGPSMEQVLTAAT